MRSKKWRIGYNGLKDFISGEANKKFIYEGLEDGFGWAGQVIGLINDVPTVNTLITRIIQQARDIRVKWISN